MNIFDHCSKFHCLLKQILIGTPDISILNCFKISKQRTLLQHLADICQFTIDRTIVDDIIRILSSGIKLFHLHIHCGKRVIILRSKVTENIFSTGEFDHLGYIIS